MKQTKLRPLEGFEPMPLNTFLKYGPFPASFFFIFAFSILIVQLVDKILRLTGFEPRIAGVGSNRSTNWATTIAQPLTTTRTTKSLPKHSNS